jgi:hypothetical protein
MDSYREIIGSDSEGMPIYREAPKKETGKSFNDSIKDLYWDVLGREPDEAGLKFYKDQFGGEISPEEEQQFFRTAEKELQGRGEGAGDPLYNLYTQNLGRAPNLQEYRKARTQFGGDVTDEEEQQFFKQEVVPELRQRQDPLFQLYRNELRRDPDAAGYRYYQEKFGQPSVIDDQMREEFLGGAGGYGYILAGKQEIPERMGSAFRDLMGREPTDQEKKELVNRVGTLNPDQLGNYLATQNLAGRSRYAPSVAPMFGSAYDPAQRANYRFDYQNPFAQFSVPTQSQAPRVSQTMNLAGQQYYQTPTSLGANYIGSPTNIAPITQGFQPVGMPSTIGGKGGFQFQPQSRSQELPSQQAPTQQFQPMGGKGVPRAITGKGG